MKKIPIDDLKPGQRFSKPVYVDGENLFVPEGLEIKDKDIERLRKWDVKVVHSDGEPLSDDPMSALNAFFLQAFNSPAQKAITKSYADLRNRMLEQFGRVRSGQDVQQDSFNSIVDTLLLTLQRGANDVIQYMLYGMQGECGEVENALNTTLLAILIGQQMQMQRHRILVVATGALLHDLGMLRLSPEIVNKQERLTAEDLRAIQTHPVHSYRILTKELGYSDEIGLVALQHQERWDGNGYPRRLAGEGIKLEARIIAVADSFVAMVSSRPYRSSMIGYTAMRNLLKDNGTRFDPNVLKVFIKVLGIYPIGSIVLLSDSSVCRVIENRSDAPLKPLVKTMIDAGGNEFRDDTGPVVDLMKEKAVFVAKAVDANSLANKIGNN